MRIADLCGIGKYVNGLNRTYENLLTGHWAAVRDYRKPVSPRKDANSAFNKRTQLINYECCHR